MYKHFPIKGTPKFTQIGIFGLKTNYLAPFSRMSLIGSPFSWTDVMIFKIFFQKNWRKKQIHSSAVVFIYTMCVACVIYHDKGRHWSKKKILWPKILRICLNYVLLVWARMGSQHWFLR
jgi:hypothetical protein